MIVPKRRPDSKQRQGKMSKTLSHKLKLSNNNTLRRSQNSRKNKTILKSKSLKLIKLPWRRKSERPLLPSSLRKQRTNQLSSRNKFLLTRTKLMKCMNLFQSSDRITKISKRRLKSSSKTRQESRRSWSKFLKATSSCKNNLLQKRNRQQFPIVSRLKCQTLKSNFPTVHFKTNHYKPKLKNSRANLSSKTKKMQKTQRNSNFPQRKKNNPRNV